MVKKTWSFFTIIILLVARPTIRSTFTNNFLQGLQLDLHLPIIFVQGLQLDPNLISTNP